MIFCAQSRFQQIRARIVLIAATALALFRHSERALSSTLLSSLRCLIARQMNILEIFSGFKSLKVWEWNFPQLGRAITATWFYLTPHFMFTLWQTRANCLGTSTWRVHSPKITNIWTLRLILSSCGLHEIWDRTYGRTMYVRICMSICTYLCV